MKRDTNIKHELEGMANTLATCRNRLPFSLPDDYFETFPEMMLDRISEVNSTHSVPTGYFETFAATMMARVRSQAVADELELIAPFLNSISKSMPHHLPEGYFEQWQPGIQKEKVQTPAKVVSLFGQKWKQWAAAAAIILTVGFGWMLLSNNEPAKSDALAENQSMEILLSELDAGSISTYLEEESIESLQFASTLISASENMETGLQKLSTDDLEIYLEKYPAVEPGS